jgi:hypothetical protein
VTGQVQRRLAAISAGDVAGYSALMPPMPNSSGCRVWGAPCLPFLWSFRRSQLILRCDMRRLTVFSNAHGDLLETRPTRAKKN